MSVCGHHGAVDVLSLVFFCLTLFSVSELTGKGKVLHCKFSFIWTPNSLENDFSPRVTESERSGHAVRSQQLEVPDAILMEASSNRLEPSD